MNTIKFTDFNTLGQPQSVILTYSNGDQEELIRWPHTKYYDKSDKQYRTWKTFSTIKNNTYV
jgi:hypothetical protein